MINKKGLILLKKALIGFLITISSFSLHTMVHADTISSQSTSCFTSQIKATTSTITSSTMASTTSSINSSSNMKSDHQSSLITTNVISSSTSNSSIKCQPTISLFKPTSSTTSLISTPSMMISLSSDHSLISNKHQDSINQSATKDSTQVQTTKIVTAAANPHLSILISIIADNTPKPTSKAGRLLEKRLIVLDFLKAELIKHPIMIEHNHQSTSLHRKTIGYLIVHRDNTVNASIMIPIILSILGGILIISYLLVILFNLHK